MSNSAPSASREHPEWIDQLYERLAGDNDGRVCDAISDGACRESPGNFFKTLLSNTLTSVGDRLASAKTTLPWLLAQLSAPPWCVSLLVPIRESGSMLPQMMIGSLVRRQPIRKWVWVAGSLLQGISLLVMGAAAMILSGLTAGLTVLALLVLFSVSRGACSIAYKDVLGKTIPKTRRGRLTGWIGSVSGCGALLGGAALAILADTESVVTFVLLLGGAGLLWLLSAIVYASIIEFPGETTGGRNGWSEGLQKLSLLRDDRPFREFVVGRALALGSALAAPFYVTLARQELGSASVYLGVFMAAEGLAGLLSAPIWGQFADRSSRLVFATACASAAFLSSLVAVWPWLPLSTTASQWFYPFAFFGLGVAHTGVRLGRKTYLVDLAEGNRRTDYTAVSNTVMGGLLLLSGAIGALAAWFSLQVAILILALAGFAGAAISLRWKEVSGESS